MVIFGALLVFTGAIFICVASDGKFSALVGTILIMLGAFIFIVICNDKPSAIDVYRGKTTLKIIYKNGVPVDSVVMFKK